MLELPFDDVKQAATVLALLVPGALVVTIRSQFLTGRGRSHKRKSFRTWWYLALLQLGHPHIRRRNQWQ